MHTVRIQEKPPGRKTLADAKDKFLQDLQRALAKEQTIASHISRVEKVPAPTPNASSDIRLRFGFMESFVRHVREKRTHVKNAEKLQELIDNTRLELAALRTPAPGKVTIKRTLNIHFKKGVIKPTDKVEERLLPRYHWEMQSGAQSWSQIGDKGAQEISPGLVDGEVRLSYRDGKLVSNKIKISTVIKRQAASAKRQQYRFAPGDPEFEQRCAGVAGQIRRLLTPPRHIVDGDFHSRVLQDRVACLPEHLNLEVVDVIDLCETGTTADADYVHMVEFVEPTIYLNPKRLHTELKDIYAGNRISLRLPSRETGTAPAVVPASPGILMLDEAEDILAQAQRNGADERERRRRRREQERLDQLEREQREQRAQEDAARIAREQAEAARQAQEDADRIAREQAEAARQAQEEADRIAREQAEAARQAQEEADRIAREQAEAAQKAREEEQARAEEVRQAEQRAKETAERLQRELELLEQQQLESERTAMKVYATKKKGVEDSSANEWFVTVKGKVYKTNSTGNDASLQPVGDANADGWYVDADAVALAEEQLKNERALARERKRLAREAKEAAEKAEAERQSLEDERLQQEAEAEAERQRLEDERLQQEAEAEAERQRLEDERLQQEAEAEAERQRLEDEERAAKIAALRGDEERLAFVKYVFTTFDVNGNGTIEEIEMVKAYLAGKTRVSTGAGQKVIDENDADGDGAIDVEEFIDWCAVSGVLENDQWKRAAEEFKARLAASTEVRTFDKIKTAMNSVRVNQKFKVKGKTYVKNGSKPRQYAPVNEGLMLVSSEQRPGELSAMVENMTDWVSSDEELNFAEQSEAESMEFAASSSLDTDSELEFAQSSERSLGANSSEEEVTSGKTSSGMEFAESSAAESDSDMEFAESSDKTSSGLEFAESSAVDESD